MTEWGVDAAITGVIRHTHIIGGCGYTDGRGRNGHVCGRRQVDGTKRRDVYVTVIFLTTGGCVCCGHALVAMEIAGGCRVVIFGPSAIGVIGTIVESIGAAIVIVTAVAVGEMPNGLLDDAAVAVGERAPGLSGVVGDGTGLVGTVAPAAVLGLRGGYTSCAGLEVVLQEI